MSSASLAIGGGMVAENNSVWRSRRHCRRFSHVMDEAHVEHAIGLVEHEDRDPIEPDMALVAKVEQASGRGDQDIDARLERFHLVMLIDAAEDNGRS